MPEIIPIRDLKSTSKISELCKSSHRPVFVTKNGYGDMVIMSMDFYEEKMAKLEIYEKIIAAEKELASGKSKDALLSLNQLREKYGL